MAITTYCKSKIHQANGFTFITVTLEDAEGNFVEEVHLNLNEIIQEHTEQRLHVLSYLEQRKRIDGVWTDKNVVSNNQLAESIKLKAKYDKIVKGNLHVQIELGD